MNAVEIEEAISQLADQLFDPENFPYAFLEAFGNKETTIKRLRAGASNKSDLGGVLQTNNIHIARCDTGQVTKTLTALKESPATTKAKARFILATDGVDFEAENLASGETVACSYKDFPDHFGFFLPLAGITTVRQISENAFDIRATSRLNRLYLALLKENSDWGTAERRHDMNHFMARLIFCFFAEDTGIFGKGMFTSTVEQMSARDSSNTHDVISTLFRAMNTKIEEWAAANLPRWASDFPYVNGGLFSGSLDVPRFNRIARSYLLHVGNLDWTKINPDIFGSMIQAVAEDEERGALGMHYTSVPNILKVLNPLFLDDLREKLQEAGDNPRMLLNLRNRMARIRVFDPACGSGNFLVIGYKEMRAIEAEINRRRGEPDRRSEIPKTNFRGIELRDFPAEIARLALVIAEYQCDVLYRGYKLALAEFLPLDEQNWITCGNALQLDWLSICPPTGTGVKLQSDDLFSTPLNQAQIDFENEGGETYICGNPPYKGSQTQTEEHKSDLKAIFNWRTANWKSLDYVSGWFMKAADYGKRTRAVAAFVATNSICQGRQVDTLWSLIFAAGYEIAFAHASFKWANLASHQAGVTVVIVGISNFTGRIRLLFSEADDAGTIVKSVDNINAYLVPASNVIVGQLSSPLSDIDDMTFGNMPNDGGYLLLEVSEATTAIRDHGVHREFIRPFVGSQEFINGLERRCIWVRETDYEIANGNTWLRGRFEAVRKQRLASSRATTIKLSKMPYRFGEVRQTGDETVTIVPSVSSETREYLPVGYSPAGTIVSNLAFALYDAPLWNMALIASRLHLVWIATVCGKMKTDFRYSNTLGWNTFPVPTLTEKNKADLTRCAEDTLDQLEHYTQARIGGNHPPETTGRFIAAKFEHDTARPVDGYVAPQLHTHAVIFNVTERDDGQPRAIQPQSLFASQQFATAIYQSELTYRLRQLGYEITTGRSGAPEIKGYTQEYLDASSPRSQQIREYLERTGRSGKEAAEIAAHSTRDRKEIHSPGEVMAAHRKLAADFGYQADAVVRTARERSQHQEQPVNSLERVRESLTFSRDKNFEREAVVDERALIRDGLRRGMGEITHGQVRSNLAARLASGEFQIVQRTQGVPGRQYTTAKTIEAEHEIISTMREGQNHAKPVLSRPHAIALADQHSHLNHAQKSVIEDVLGSPDRIQGIQGFAGSGKTTALTVIRNAAESQGYQVEGFAPTSRAARQLNDAGIESGTLQGFLARAANPDLPEQRHFYVVDESSLASTNQMREFLSRLDPNDRVLLVGDIRQHQGVEAGRPFEQLQDAGMRTATLDDIVRQKDPALKSAVELLATGQVSAALDVLQQQGRVKEIPNQEERVRAIAKSYLESTQNTLIVSPDNASRRELNVAVRQELKANGSLAPQDHSFRVLVQRQDMTGAERSWASHYEINDVVRYTRGSKAIGIGAGAYASVIAIDPALNQLTVEKANLELATYDPRRLTGVSVYQEIDRQFSVGDRVQFTAPYKSIGVANRDLAVVDAIHPDGRMSTRLDNNRQIEFNAGELRHFDHGYAVTSHSSQGLTTERVLVHADSSVHPDLLNSRFAYVSISRASHEVTLFTDDLAKLAPQLSADVSKTCALEMNESSSVARGIGLGL